MTSFAEKLLVQEELHGIRRENVLDSRRLRLAVLLAGAAGTAYGVIRRGWAGSALAAGGASLMYGAAARKVPVANCFVVSQTIQRQPEEVYDFLRDYRNWPRFKKDLKSVREAAPGIIAWTIQAQGQVLEGETRILDQEPGRMLRWRSASAGISYEAAAELRPAPGDRGTEVHLWCQSTSLTNPLSQIARYATGGSLEQRAREQLRTIKQLLETGEVATIAGQPHGPRGLKGKAQRILFHESVGEVNPPSGEDRNPELRAS